MLLKVSTARSVDIVMVASTDHIAGAAGKTLTIYAAKNGGTPASISPTVTELDATNMPGVYSLALTTTHTNTKGDLTLHITATGCDPTSKTWQVLTDLPGDTVASVTGAVGSIGAGGINSASYAADSGMQSARTGTAQAGGATSITLDAGASAVTDFYAGSWVSITGGTGAIQTRLIIAYNGTTKVATIARAWATNPDNTSTFAVRPAAAIIQIAGDVTGNVGGNVAGSTGSVTAGVSVGAGGITAASFAANSITAAAAAADLTTELQAGLSTLDAAGVRTALGVGSANIDTQLSAIAAAVAASAIRTALGLGAANLDTQLGTISSAVAAAAIRSALGLGSANLDTQLSAIAALVAGSAIASAVWGAATRSLTDKASFTLTAGERTAIANAVEAEIIDETDSEKVLTAITDKIAAVNPDLGGLTLTAIGAAVRTNLATELARIDVATSTRLAGTSYTAPPSAATIAVAVVDQTLTGHGTAGTVGGALTASGGAGDPWGTALPGSYPAGSAGYILAGRASQASVDAVGAKTINLPASPAASGDAAAALTAAGYTSTRAANLDNADVATSTRSTYAGGDTSGITTLLTRLSSARATNLDFIDVATSSRLAGGAYVAPDNATITAIAALATAIKVSTDALPGDPADQSDMLDAFGALQTAIAALGVDVSDVPASVWSPVLLEDYAAIGDEFTPAQALYMIVQLLSNRDVVSTLLTAYKLDGTTPAMTFTLNDATVPTAQTRAT